MSDTGRTAHDDQAPGRHRARAPGPDSGAQRGRTDIADKVVATIAGHAMQDVPDAGGISRRVLGVKLGADSADQDAQATATVDGSIATISMQLSVIYPAPVRQTAAAVRERVSNEVTRLTGLEVRGVDIEVRRLLPRFDRTRRVQ